MRTPNHPTLAASDTARRSPAEITTNAYRYRCRLTAQAPAEVVAEHIGPTIGIVTPLDQASCELVAGSDSLDEMAIYIGLIGEEIIVHEPVELYEHITALAARLIRAAERSKPSSKSRLA